MWIVSNEQLLAWVRNPVPVSQLDSFSGLKCTTPAVDASLQICNGVPQNEAGALVLVELVQVRLGARDVAHAACHCVSAVEREVGWNLERLDLRKCHIQ